MEKRLIAIAPTASVNSAIRLMKTASVNLLPVVKHGKLLGMLKEEDLLTYLLAHSDSLDETIGKLVKKPIFAEEKSSLGDAVKLVVKNELSRLPIVESRRSMKCIGIVSTTDLLKEAEKTMQK